jgi:ubiquinone/menaquinone biosynthesis C-methylase UbiE
MKWAKNFLTVSFDQTQKNIQMKDNFSKQADLYAKYRPTYPPELFEFIISQVREKDMAWDCATGNGQSAKALSPHFNKVYATDISQKQIDNAYQAENIFYSVQPAEQTIFLNNSFDLITVSQALHWFKFDEFYKEVNRVAKQGAIIAAWCYSLLRISKEIDAIIDAYHYKTMADYWDNERKYVDDEYRGIPFPFEKINTPSFQIEYKWSLEDLEGYLNTWSALQNYIAANNTNPVPALIKNIKRYWKQSQMSVHFPIHLLVGRIEK